MNKKVIFFILVYFLNIFTIFGDTRTQNIDVYLVLDKSLSMEEEIDSVKEYVADKIVKEILIPGDYFTLILFYGKAAVAYSGTVPGEKEKDLILKEISSIKADGHFTDIGNALDMLKEVLSDSRSSRMKYLLLITDGKQEAPPESRYYSPDHSFNHEFLKNVKIIQKKGWKIEILGIGVESAARELAEKLSGSYREVSSSATSGEIAAAVGNLLGTVTVKGAAKFTSVKKGGDAYLEFDLSGSGYKSPVSIEVSAILLNSPYDTDLNILKKSPLSIEVPPEGSVHVKAEVEIPVKKDRYDGELSFVFGQGDSFSPGLMRISVPSVVNYLALVYILIAVSAVVLAVLFLRRRKRDRDDENQKKKTRTNS